jgi:vacuolar-type H+-ATPase subunit H
VILEAEADAHRQFDAARAQAAEIVRQAEMEAQEQVRAARDARENEAAAVEEGLVAAAQQQVTRILATADATAAAMQEQAAGRLHRAVEAVVNVVLAPPALGASDGR